MEPNPIGLGEPMAGVREPGYRRVSMEPNPIGLGEYEWLAGSDEARGLNGAESDRTRRVEHDRGAIPSDGEVSMEPNPIGLGELLQTGQRQGGTREVSMEPNPIGLGEEQDTEGLDLGKLSQWSRIRSDSESGCSPEWLRAGSIVSMEPNPIGLGEDAKDRLRRRARRVSMEPNPIGLGERWTGATPPRPLRVSMEPNPIGLGEFFPVFHWNGEVQVSMEPNPIGLGEKRPSRPVVATTKSLNGAESDRTRRAVETVAPTGFFLRSQWSRIRSDSERPTCSSWPPARSCLNGAESDRTRRGDRRCLQRLATGGLNGAESDRTRRVCRGGRTRRGHDRVSMEPNPIGLGEGASTAPPRRLAWSLNGAESDRTRRAVGAGARVAPSRSLNGAESDRTRRGGSDFRGSGGSSRLNGAESDRTRRVPYPKAPMPSFTVVSMEPNPIGLGEEHRRNQAKC